MAVDVTGGDLKFVATLDTTQLQDQSKKAGNVINDFGNKAEGAAKKTQGLFSSLLSANVVTQVASKAFDILSDSIEAALEKQDLLAGFKAQMENLGQVEVFDRLGEAAENLSKRFKFLDTSEIVKGFQQLVNYGKLTEQQIKDLMPVIIDFAAKNRVSIESATGTIVKALEGGGAGLKKFGINIKANSTEAQRLEAIMGSLAGKVKGAADAFGASSQGQLKTAQQQFSDLKEELGTQLIPALTAVVDFAVKAVKGIKLIANNISDLFNLRRLGFTNDKEFQEEQRAKDETAFFRGKVNETVAIYKKEIDAGKKKIEDIQKELQAVLDSKTASEKAKKLATAVLVSFSQVKVGGGGVDVNNDKAKEQEKAAEKAQREAERRQREINRLLEQRENILQKIADIQRDSANTGLSEEAKQLDELAQKYDALILSVEDYNEKAGKLGQKTVSTAPIEEAKQVALTNLRLKQDADKYTEFLNNQKRQYLAFEETKKQIGIEKAKEQYSDLSGQFESYQDFLKQQVKENLPKIQLALSGFGNLLNVGDQEKIRKLLAAVGDEGERQKQIHIQRFAELLQLTNDYNDKQREIAQRYNDFYAALEKEKTNFSAEEYQRRLDALKKAQGDEETELRNSLIRQSDLYKSLSEDMIAFSREQLKEKLKGFQDQLKSGVFKDADGTIRPITPEVQQAIEQAIAGIKNLLNSTNDTAIAAGKVALKFAGAAKILGSLKGLVSQFDAGLADAIETMESLAGAGSDIATAVGAFASGDILGGIGAAVSGIGKLVGALFGESEEEKRFKARIKEIEAAQYLGEFKINELYRERQREQVRLNELRLVGIQKETDLLISQQREIQNQYNELFARIEQLTFTASKEQIAAFFQANPQLGVFEKQLILTNRQLPLLGKSFEELERLNTFGQLEGEAKAFFDQLQKLKEEGVDVQKAWNDLMKERQELATGTTEDALLDSVVEMFRRGTASAQDFAKNFEELMKGAILNSLKFQYLQEPLKAFFAKFAELTQQGDLTSDQIDELQNMYTGILTDAQKKFNELQKIAGLNFSDNLSTSGNNLQSAIKGMTEQQAELLAGQFAGQRVATLQLVDLVRVGNGFLNAISVNTATMVLQLRAAVTVLENVVTGAASFKIR